MIILGVLSDDLTGIYDDMKDGLGLIVPEDSATLEQAAALWKFQYLIHTGHHSASSLRAFQELLERYFDH